MTVKQLIKRLGRVPGHFEVWTEGCDCYGDVGFVARGDMGGQDAILLARSEETRGMDLDSGWERMS